MDDAGRVQRRQRASDVEQDLSALHFVPREGEPALLPPQPDHAHATVGKYVVLQRLPGPAGHGARGGISQSSGINDRLPRRQSALLRTNHNPTDTHPHTCHHKQTHKKTNQPQSMKRGKGRRADLGCKVLHQHCRGFGTKGGQSNQVRVADRRERLDAHADLLRIDVAGKGHASHHRVPKAKHAVGLRV